MHIVALIRRTLLRATILTVSLASAVTAQHGLTATNLAPDGLALHGYDPVAYFTDAKPVLGSATFTATHEGATFRFSSTEHRTTFLANPARYVPQFGGYCAMGVAVGKKLDVDPALWKIVNGKLYLNVNKDAQGMWLKDPAKHIATAAEKWATVSGHKGFDKM